jgi:TonB-dependent SusC/RagA subfamily outer membrane receptor
MRRLRVRVSSVLWATLGVVIGAGAAAAQAVGNGTVTGRVVDAGTGAAVGQAQVRLVGSVAGTTTNDSGYFRLQRIPSGLQSIRALRLGYNPASVTVTILEGQTVTAPTIKLVTAAAVLTATTITATGQTEEARQQAAFVPSLSPDSIELAATPTFANVLEGKIPGVDVTTSSGSVGLGTRIRIRGANSISLSGAPLIIIDNVEVDNTEDTFHGSAGLNLGVGGQSPSRYDDLDPNEFESIETLQGPAATGLYGTSAANGAIVITTKKGVPGPAQWTFHAQYGTLNDDNNYPANYSGWSGGSPGACGALPQVIGACTPDSVTSNSPLLSHESTLREGHQQEYGAQVAGGTDLSNYFISGNYLNQTGTYTSNAWIKENARANFTARPTKDFTVSASIGYIASNVEIPQNDNNSLGILGQALLGTGASGPDFNYGYFGPVTPEATANLTTFQDIQRWTPGVNASYQPLSWLSFNGTAGMDLSNEAQTSNLPPGILDAYGSPYSIGFHQRNQLEQEDYTLLASTTARFNITQDITSATTVGGSWRRELFTGNYAYGAGQPTGANSLNAVTSLFAVDEVNDDERTLGGFVQEQMSFYNRYYLTVGVRVDKTSTAGVASGPIYYPEFEGSWVVSDESWFPKQDYVSALKARAAYGQSGLRPTLLQAISYYTSVASTQPSGASVPALTPGGLGLSSLKPERDDEWEAGLDAGLFKDRVNVSGTYFDKTGLGALVAANVVPSAGTVASEIVNVGGVKNRGWEFSADANIADFRFVRFDLHGQWFILQNYLMTLGPGQSPIITGLGGNTQEVTPGYQLGAYFQPAYKYTSTAGIVTPADITILNGGAQAFGGNDLPTHEASITPTITLFKIIKVSSLFDYRGGYKLYNSTQQFRCGEFLNCAEDFNGAKTPVATQAADVAQAAYGTSFGYFEDAGFWKWREASITAILPDAWAKFAHSRGMQVTFSARNLRTWTKYPGLDPEVSSQGQASFFPLTSSDFLTQPPVRYYTVRLDLNF